MGAWSDEIFGNDLACDVQDHYRELIEAGDDPATATKKTKRTFTQFDADEKRTAWIALAATKLTFGDVIETVREQALKAIAFCEHPDRDPEQTPFGASALNELRLQLGGPESAPKAIPKHKVPPGNKGDVFAVKLGHTIGEAVIVVAGPAFRGEDYWRIVLLPNLKVAAVTIESIQAELAAWRRRRQVWHDGRLGHKVLGIYDVIGKLPARKCKLLLAGVLLPQNFEQRQSVLAEIPRATDLPYCIENDMSDLPNWKWEADPDET